MYIVEVDVLPWSHRPFKCAHKRMFEAAIPRADKDRWENWLPYVEAVARSLSDDQIRLCPYHRADWNLAAEAAINCWQKCESDDPSVAAEFLSQVGLPTETGLAALSFLTEPIWLNSPLLGGGQHRVCAMKLAGVPRCLVEE